MEHIEAILRVYEIRWITLEVQCSSLQLVRRESQLLGNTGFNLREFRVVLVGTNKFIIKSHSILRIEVMLSPDGPERPLCHLHRLTLVHKVFLVLLRGQDEYGLPGGNWAPVLVQRLRLT